MRIVSISGTHDSGKTSTIKALITQFTNRGKRCSVIVNEEGKEIYDKPFIRGQKISIEYLRGG